jgi:hypothetical protein
LLAVTTGEDYRNTDAHKKCPPKCPVDGRGQAIAAAFKPIDPQKHRKIM